MDVVIGVDFPKKVIPLFDIAKSEIKIIVFDWRWYPNDPSSPVQLFNQAIVRAVKRGVVVTALVNSNAIEQQLKNVGVAVKVCNTKKLMHAKMIIIDDKIVVVGSHNYTQNAFSMNHELSVILDGEFDVFPFANFFTSLCRL